MPDFNEHHPITRDQPTDFAEVRLLLPNWQVNALESVAAAQGLTTGQLIRRLISQIVPAHHPAQTSYFFSPG